MRLLDLFCGAGGAAMGYHQAGVNEIVGVDIEPQPDYPFEFVQADALLPWEVGPPDQFDLIHASPPCQAYTPMSNRWGSDHPELIDDVRALLEASGQDWVIENVAGAGLDGIQLCGSSFGLQTRRHRRFEASWLLWGNDCDHEGDEISVYGKPDGRWLWKREDGSTLHAWSSVEEGQRALGIDWTDNWHSIREAIPPAYTKYIGEQFLAQHALA